MADKLREPRVNQIIAALFTGEQIKQLFPGDDLKYLEDLGLIRTRPQLTIVNPYLSRTDSSGDHLAEGLAQTADYADRVNADEATW